MTLEQLIGLALLALMMGIVLLATQFVASAEHNGKGLWHITVRYLFWCDNRYRSWVKDNTVYYWCLLLIACLIVIILGLIPPFREGKVYVRPIVTLIFSVPLWASIYYTYRWFIRRLRKI